MFTGTLLNTGAVLVGSVAGLLLGRRIPERFGHAILTGLALCTMYIAIDGISAGDNMLVTVLSVVLGAAIGEALRLDDRLTALGNRLQETVNRRNRTGGVSLAEGFVTATLLYCVGAMVIMGALEAGLGEGHSIYTTKAMLDGISSLVYASTLGVGVCCSAVSVLAVQSGLVLLASVVAPYLQAAQGEMVCVGSLLLIGLALNLLGLTKIKVMNYAPAIFMPILLCRWM